MKYALITDLHLGDPLGENSVANFEQAITQINTEKVDMTFILGDIIFPGYFEQFQRSITNLDSPFYCLPGNNDKLQARRKILELCIETKLFHLQNANNDFIFIDVTTPESHNGRLSEEQILELERLVSSLPPNNNIFLLMHIPASELPFEQLSSEDKKWYFEPESRLRLVNFLNKYPIKAIFCGHRHRKEDFLLGNTRCITIQSTCWNDGDFPLGYIVMETDKNSIIIHDRTLSPSHVC